MTQVEELSGLRMMRPMSHGWDKGLQSCRDLRQAEWEELGLARVSLRSKWHFDDDAV